MSDTQSDLYLGWTLLDSYGETMMSGSQCAQCTLYPNTDEMLYDADGISKFSSNCNSGASPHPTWCTLAITESDDDDEGTRAPRRG